MSPLSPHTCCLPYHESSLTTQQLCIHRKERWSELTHFSRDWESSRNNNTVTTSHHATSLPSLHLDYFLEKNRNPRCGAIVVRPSDGGGVILVVPTVSCIFLETSGQIVRSNIWREYSIKHFRHILARKVPGNY